MSNRTELQRACDDIDCDLFRLITRVERLYDANKRKNRTAALDIHNCLQSMRAARYGLREQMHEDDKARTV